jgi:ribosome-binding protein aMBF1 (putative translation factor)
MTPVGNRINELRSEAGLSVDELAAKADVSPQRLADMEAGGSVPTQYECAALEAALPPCKAGELEALARPLAT